MITRFKNFRNSRWGRNIFFSITYILLSILLVVYAFPPKSQILAIILFTFLGSVALGSNFVRHQIDMAKMKQKKRGRRVGILSDPNLPQGTTKEDIMPTLSVLKKASDIKDHLEFNEICKENGFNKRNAKRWIKIYVEDIKAYNKKKKYKKNAMNYM
jgi:hypothetical protein